MILAPLQGLTEVLFRRVYEECYPGAIAQAVTPFLSLTHNIQYSKGNSRQTYLSDVLPENNKGSIPVTPQILGREPEEFVELVRILADMGYNEVNWNIGCPMRAVTGKRRGSGILPYPDEVRRVLDSVVPRLACQLSVKMRIGLRDKREIFEVIPVLNDYPLASVTIHPRTGRQQYGGTVDLDIFGEALPLLNVPVIYNGDICTAADARRIKERFPQVADLMVGRGVLYNPLLPLQINGIDTHFVMPPTQFIRHLIEAINVGKSSEASRMRKTKEYWGLLWRALPISEIQAREVLRAQDLAAVDNLINDFTQ